MNDYEEKLVSEYCGVSIFEVYNMEVFEFWYFLHDAVIFGNSQTEEGRKHLDKCWRLEQTEPDKEKLREKFGGGKYGG